MVKEFVWNVEKDFMQNGNEEIRLIRTEYPEGKNENKCPKCSCISLNFLYFSPIKKWLCPGCDKYVDLKRVI